MSSLEIFFSSKIDLKTSSSSSVALILLIFYHGWQRNILTCIIGLSGSFPLHLSSLEHWNIHMQDWADLWRPELAGRISMIDSPREIVGAVLKSMGASYNTHDFTSQVSGGKTALLKKLALLAEQVSA